MDGLETITIPIRDQIAKIDELIGTELMMLQVFDKANEENIRNDIRQGLVTFYAIRVSLLALTTRKVVGTMLDIGQVYLGREPAPRSELATEAIQ